MRFQQAHTKRIGECLTKNPAGLFEAHDECLTEFLASTHEAHE